MINRKTKFKISPAESQRWRFPYITRCTKLDTVFGYKFYGMHNESTTTVTCVQEYEILTDKSTNHNITYGLEQIPGPSSRRPKFAEGKWEVYREGFGHNTSTISLALGGLEVLDLCGASDTRGRIILRRNYEFLGSPQHGCHCAYSARGDCTVGSCEAENLNKRNFSHRKHLWVAIMEGNKKSIKHMKNFKFMSLELLGCGELELKQQAQSRPNAHLAHSWEAAQKCKVYKTLPRSILLHLCAEKFVAW